MPLNSCTNPNKSCKNPSQSGKFDIGSFVKSEWRQFQKKNTIELLNDVRSSWEKSSIANRYIHIFAIIYESIGIQLMEWCVWARHNATRLVGMHTCVHVCVWGCMGMMTLKTFYYGYANVSEFILLIRIRTRGKRIWMIELVRIVFGFWWTSKA